MKKINNTLYMNGSIYNHYALEGKIVQFQQNSAIIETSDGQKISWPKTFLPPDCVVGGKVRLKLTTSPNDIQEREEIAKTLLNELLEIQ